jgi:hypothetical protein
MAISKEFRISKTVWLSFGFSPRRIGLGFSIDRYYFNIDFLCFWITLEY